jgi:hypothetical protein
MSEVQELHIRCLNCNVWIKIPILFGEFVSSFISKLVGEQVECPHCEKMTGCIKENMQFRAEDADFVGKDT